ncbi:MAG TPA: hypothetical protein VKP04_04580 [Ktedonobacteraceae bacterium]|nr:hypothetical protein [Ktedonobacteraceae bacterium]
MAECPNCGGYRVSEETSYISKGYETSESAYYRSVIFIGLLAIGLIIWGVTQISNTTISGIALILIGITLVFLIPVQLRKYWSLPVRYKFKCVLCGYSWKMDEGEAQPEVTVRPELIAKGEDRIAKQQQQAAAQWKANMDYYHFVMHQKKKK